MLHFLPGPLRFLLGVLLYTTMSLFWAFWLVVFFLLEHVMPLRQWRLALRAVRDQHIPHGYTHTLKRLCAMLNKIQWEVDGVEDLSPRHWYLMLANHQSWIDILVVQIVFSGKVPFPKFFAKSSLRWLPLVGQVALLLNFPFMSRYSKAQLQARPELKGKDIDITKRACERFKDFPTTVISFVEGTRFSVEKRIQQASPYLNLLRPRAGGVAFTLATLGETLQEILDVTIVYKGSKLSIWNFLTGRVRTIVCKVRRIPIPQELFGDYENDLEFRVRFQQWINDCWEKKDKLISEIKVGLNTGIAMMPTNQELQQPL